MLSSDCASLFVLYFYSRIFMSPWNKNQWYCNQRLNEQFVKNKNLDTCKTYTFIEGLFTVIVCKCLVNSHSAEVASCTSSHKSLIELNSCGIFIRKRPYCRYRKFPVDLAILQGCHQIPFPLNIATWRDLSGPRQSSRDDASPLIPHLRVIQTFNDSEAAS